MVLKTGEGAISLTRFHCNGDYSNPCLFGQAEHVLENINGKVGLNLGQLWFTALDNYAVSLIQSSLISLKLIDSN